LKVYREEVIGKVNKGSDLPELCRGVDFSILTSGPDQYLKAVKKL